MRGYLRADGRKGIRNVIAVAYLVDCAHHVAREIVLANRDLDVHLIGFPGCYRSEFAEVIMTNVCTHPNVGAVLLVMGGLVAWQQARQMGERPGEQPGDKRE